MDRRWRRGGRRAFTVTELVMAVAIVGILAAVFVSNILGSLVSDKLERAAQLLYSDLMYIRIRSISTTTQHRIHFTSTTQWRVEKYIGGAPPTDWEIDGEVRTMPNDTYLTMTAFTNAGGNLEANSRGLYDFQNGMSGDPYVTIEGLGTDKTKLVRVSAAGYVELVNNY